MTKRSKLLRRKELTLFPLQERARVVAEFESRPINYCCITNKP